MRSTDGVQIRIEHTEKAFRRRLFKWWAKNKLSYPWRSYSDPWKVLVAETLLRKTNAEKVERFIPAVISRLPNPKAAAAIQTRSLERLLKPFGMQSRKATELKQLAKALLEDHHGKVPADLEALKRLPGVGDYIANAVLCFAFGKRRAVVDTNVIRVFAQVFGFSSKRARPRTDPDLWRFAEALLPHRRFKEYNWAVLDLGKRLRGKVTTEPAWPPMSD